MPALPAGHGQGRRQAPVVTGHGNGKDRVADGSTRRGALPPSSRQEREWPSPCRARNSWNRLDVEVQHVLAHAALRVLGDGGNLAAAGLYVTHPGPALHLAASVFRSDERRLGKQCVCTCVSVL